MSGEHVDGKIVLLYRCFSVVFVIFGTVCNLISAIVYSRKHMRQTSFAVYLLALAIVDLCVTWIGNVRFILMFYQMNLTSTQSNTTSGIDIRETSMFMCRLHRFLTYYLLQLSSALLCMLNIDRFIGCVLVLQSTTYCKTSVAKRCILFTSIILFLTNVHFLVGMGYYDKGKNHTHLICEPNQGNYVYMAFWNVYIWIDSIVYALLPFFIMIFCNFVIIIRIVRSRVRSGSVRQHKTPFDRLASVKSNSQNQQRPGVRSRRHQMLPSERRVSFILIGISFSFLLLTMPVSILETFLIDALNKPSYSLTLAISYMLMYSNHVINFFFYCSIGAKFRNEVKNMFPFKYLVFILNTNKIRPDAVITVQQRRSSFNNLYKRYKKFNKPSNKFTKTSVSYAFERTSSYRTRTFITKSNPFITTTEVSTVVSTSRRTSRTTYL